MLLLIGSLLVVHSSLNAQTDKILGYWLNAEATSQIRIFKATNGKYYGAIEWLETPMENGKVRIDDKNPNVELRSKPLMGLQILKGFSYNEKAKNWEKGTIYDPKNGKTYDCYMWFEGNNDKVLKIKGYVLGMRWLGRQTTWTREDKKR
jgi:uncharacterized protein (DUF2147 family)